MDKHAARWSILCSALIIVALVLALLGYDSQLWLPICVFGAGLGVGWESRGHVVARWVALQMEEAFQRGQASEQAYHESLEAARQEIDERRARLDAAVRDAAIRRRRYKAGHEDPDGEGEAS